MRSATLALPYSDVNALITHGTPSDGKSVGIKLLTLPSVDFIAAHAAFTYSSRFIGSAMWVPRLTTVIDAWLSDVASPLARVETGTAATSDLRGNGPCCSSWR